MDLKQELAHRSSKVHMIRLAHTVCKEPKLYAELIDLILNAKPPIPQYGAWLLQHCSNIQPELILPHVEPLLNLLTEDIHDGVRRSILRAFTEITLPPSAIGQAADLCFAYLADPKEPVAVRVFAMSVLWGVCKQEPDLIDELVLLIDTVTPTSTAALAARGRMVKKEIVKWGKMNL